jgi:Fungal specific transcription factor domain/Fungal Zn(2)-Cys(6) binuclear cluster domain
MPHHPRSSVGSTGAQSYGHGRDGLGGSDAWESSSSVSQAPCHSDKQPPKPVSDPSNKKADKREDGIRDEEEEPPPWVDLKTKAGKERKRLPLACIACRRKKIRCSGEKPACKHCLRSRIPCIYKVTARKAAPRTDYMAMLGKRLKRMEERVIKTIPKEDLPDLSTTGGAVVKPALPVPVAKTSKLGPTKKRYADEAFEVELHDWTRSKQLHLPGNPSQSNKSKDQVRKMMMAEGVEFLPSKELREHLAEVFFDCVYGQSYLLLHKPTFMRKLKAETVAPLLVLAVCAVSARFSTHPQVSTEPVFLRGDQWAAPARAILEKRHADPNITILLAVIILGLHYFGTCEGGLSWSFGGQAMRMAFALQLHKESDYDAFAHKSENPAELDFVDREIRRRAMWASFLMDRFNSAGTERPPFGNEEYIRIQLPVKESHFQMEIPAPTEDLEGNVPMSAIPDTGQATDPKENMGVSAYSIRAVALWGTILKYLNLGGKEKDKHPFWSTESGFAKLQADIGFFEKSIPSSMIYNTENLQNHAAEKIANQFLYFHLVCQQNILFLYRFAIPASPHAQTPPRDMPKEFLNDAGQRVVEAANQISHLIEQGASHRLTVPFAGYCAYVASTVHVWGMFSRNLQLEAVSKENLRRSYKYLNKAKKYWGVLNYMAENVKNIYRQFADAASLGAPSIADSSETDLALVQYGDLISNSFYKKDSSEAANKETESDVVSGQRSDLQSVEDFFASLSPPSKAEQSRKITRKNVKKAREIKGQPSTQRRAQQRSQTYPQPQEQQSRRQSEPHPQALHVQNLAPSTATQPGSFGDTGTHNVSSSPEHLYPPQDPQTSNFGLAPQTLDFQLAPFWPTNTLPHLDRQLVFDAYAGLDTYVDPGLNNAAGFATWDGTDMNAPFDSIDGGGMSGVVDGSAMYTYGPSPAWFMPFNMNPQLIGDDGASLFFGAGNAAASFAEQGAMVDGGMAGGQCQG